MSKQTTQEMIEAMQSFEKDGIIDLYHLYGSFYVVSDDPLWNFSEYIYKPHFKHREMKEEFEKNREKYSHVECFYSSLGDWIKLEDDEIAWSNTVEYRLVEKKTKDLFDDYEPFTYDDALIFICKPIQDKEKNEIDSFNCIRKNNISIDLIEYFNRRWTFLENGLPFGKLKQK